MKQIRVLIIDDSLFMRRLLTDILSDDPRICVVGAAPDAIVARSMIRRYAPDVLTLDINMPCMNGLEFLDKVMRLQPTPVVMFAAMSGAGTEAVRALERGAIEVVAKPNSGTDLDWKSIGDELIAKVKLAAAVQFHRRSPFRLTVGEDTDHSATPSDRMIAIGASTGGVMALHTIMASLPQNSPPIVIAQHMPAKFTRQFAERLDAHSLMRVREARDGDVVAAGSAYVAPGDRHLSLERVGETYVCRLHDGADGSDHSPSVDVLFSSLAETAGRSAVGIVLSGMGRDGTAGLMRIKEAGGVTIAQSRASSLVYGMPKSARDSGAATYEADLTKIPWLIAESTRGTLTHSLRSLNRRAMV